jgi:uncharacterized zinc-type alcohol dehydrogenase-like protein
MESSGACLRPRHDATSVSASPNGAPSTTAQMLNFAARHNILPQAEHFPLAKVNDAIPHLLDGKARNRIVLDM